MFVLLCSLPPSCVWSWQLWVNFAYMFGPLGILVQEHLSLMSWALLGEQAESYTMAYFSITSKCRWFKWNRYTYRCACVVMPLRSNWLFLKVKDPTMEVVSHKKNIPKNNLKYHHVQSVTYHLSHKHWCCNEAPTQNSPISQIMMCLFYCVFFLSFCLFPLLIVRQFVLRRVPY